MVEQKTWAGGRRRRCNAPPHYILLRSVQHRWPRQDLIFHRLKDMKTVPAWTEVAPGGQDSAWRRWCGFAKANGDSNVSGSNPFRVRAATDGGQTLSRAGIVDRCWLDVTWTAVEAAGNVQPGGTEPSEQPVSRALLLRRNHLCQRWCVQMGIGSPKVGAWVTARTRWRLIGIN
ncbi:hypothetical protein LZ31DRAFT_6646 [Colletotrichum somersetense]|nr:hypothetical protein LZ31DRAFT_6646 [Colletotrichum somersetense]